MIPPEYADELVAFTQDLVRIQSYSGQEEVVLRFIAGRMQALGYDEVRFDGLGNVLGRIGSAGPSIQFDSHLDTVAVNDASEWLHPPFSGAIEAGRLYGRGSVDMKSGAAASIYAAALAKRLGLAQGKTVYVSATVFEEDCDGENLKHLYRELNLKPDFVIVCEPSENQIAIGHKGKAQIVIKTFGVSAHGASPEKGQNAVYEMAEIIQRVEKRNAELMQQPAPRGTLVLARIASTAASLNAVPSECEIYLDRRMTLGETLEQIRQEMDTLIAGKRAAWEVGTLHRKSYTGAAITYEPLHTAWQIDLQQPLAQAARAAYRETFGRPAEDYLFWDYSTNAVTPVSLGIPTIGFGPGEHKLAHMRDENVPVSQILEACSFYTHLIQEL